MFELSIAFKYLIPRKKQLSVSLIALLSVTVISLVVWLVLVFLSVTEGIERNWLHKLTTLNAPLRITPTQEYYNSYYYQVDAVSAKAHYASKTIAEKAESLASDPYDPSEDGQLPHRFPAPDRAADGSLKDPVKGLFALLSQYQESHPDLTYQDFEISGALMRLQLLRPATHVHGEETQGYLTQVSYLASLPDRCPNLRALLLAPTEKDLNHALYLASHTTELSRQDAPALTAKTTKEVAGLRVQKILQGVAIKQLKPRYPIWQVPPSLLPQTQAFDAQAHFRNGKLQQIAIPTDKALALSLPNPVKVWREGSDLFLQDSAGHKEKVSPSSPILISGEIPLYVKNLNLDNARYPVQGTLQGIPFHTDVPLEDLEIVEADLSHCPWETPLKCPLSLGDEKETGVLLSKSFSDNGVLIGDRGYLSYSSTTSSSVQEHRLPIFVSGFYDPGILSIGNKCILVPPFVTRTINASNSAFNLDKTESSGVLVWFNDLHQAEEIKAKILSGLQSQGLESYWKVTTFRNYDFAKDLFEQFHSDRSLFTLVGIIILIVACCNIISMLVLLVNDKKREIGILQAIGASPLSIAALFGICGITMGILSSIIGTTAAVLTLKNIDAIAQLLSFFQGHDAFNTTFFGKSLPSELSHSALLFILIATPLLSLLAGLIPAIKACRLRPADILRAE